jgi:NDP-sugar pyrophosphorylase family protein
MGYTIPVKIYEKLEEKLGKETASVLVEFLERSIDETFKDSKETLKIIITEELKKELATKYDLKLVETELRKEIDLVKKEIDLVRKEIDLVKKEIDLSRQEMHKEIALVRKDMKIITVILLAAIILLNQNSLEFLARLLGLLK